jgi:hypothetical protein
MTSLSSFYQSLSNFNKGAIFSGTLNQGSSLLALISSFTFIHSMGVRPSVQAPPMCCLCHLLAWILLSSSFFLAFIMHNLLKEYAGFLMLGMNSHFIAKLPRKSDHLACLCDIRGLVGKKVNGLWYVSTLKVEPSK